MHVALYKHKTSKKRSPTCCSFHTIWRKFASYIHKCQSFMKPCTLLDKTLKPVLNDIKVSVINPVYLFCLNRNPSNHPKPRMATIIEHDCKSAQTRMVYLIFQDG